MAALRCAPINSCYTRVRPRSCWRTNLYQSRELNSSWLAVADVRVRVRARAGESAPLGHREHFPFLSLVDFRVCVCTSVRHQKATYLFTRFDCTVETDPKERPAQCCTTPD